MSNKKETLADIDRMIGEELDMIHEKKMQSQFKGCEVPSKSISPQLLSSILKGIESSSKILHEGYVFNSEFLILQKIQHPPICDAKALLNRLDLNQRAFNALRSNSFANQYPEAEKLIRDEFNCLSSLLYFIECST